MNTAKNAIATSTKNITFDYIHLESMAEIQQIAADRFGDTIALKDPHAKTAVEISYRELQRKIQQFALTFHRIRA